MDKNVRHVFFAFLSIMALLAGAISGETATAQPAYPIVETAQSQCYDSTDAITCPDSGQAFYGQDASYQGNVQMYNDNGDGTVTDMVTGLMWQQDFVEQITYAEAVAAADTISLAGYNDWRLPTIKELYSLMNFTGTDPSGYDGTDTTGLIPFIDTDYFRFAYGDVSIERLIDAQYWSSTEYVSTTMNGDATVFGVNFADGRIKGYPRDNGPDGSPMMEFVRYVRGNESYGINDFTDNGDSTITDAATGLLWMQYDSNSGLSWQEALDWAENLVYAGYDDWRLPDVKELQSIVDYTRSPATTGSAAIDPLFYCSEITDEGGGTNYPFYWSSTTHANWSPESGAFASYVCFGEALGFMEVPPMSGNYELWDVHGAGAQRSDPKVGDPADYPYGHGPQGDVIRVYNYVRCVRTAVTELSCGDANSDGSINIGDSIYLVNYIFRGGPAPEPEANGDPNCDGSINVGDAVYLINYIFRVGPEPCC